MNSFVWAASAENLHENTQILNIPGKRAANRRRIVRPWGKSSAFNSGDRDCHGGCSTTAGGWIRRPSALPSSPCRNATRRSLSPRSGISPSFNPENKNMPIATASDFEIAPARPLLTPLVLAAGCGALTNRLLGERLREIFRSSTRTSLRTH
jgi:hypothetical protein